MDTRTDLAERLRRAREEVGLTQQQVADWLGIRRPAVAEMEAGSRTVKSSELAKLASLYGRSLRWMAAGDPGPEESIGAALFRSARRDDPVLRREAARLARRCTLVGELEHRLGTGRRARVPEYCDPTALEDRSRAIKHGREVAYQERARLGIGNSAPLGDAWGVVEDAGIRVFPLHLGDDHPIDGIFTRLGSGRSCVGVNTDKWVFRQVFTVVHEYGHALMDADLEGEACETVSAWRGQATRAANRELRANQFAAVFLVPREALLRFLESRGKLLHSTRRASARDLSAVELVRAQDHFGVSGDMLLWRLQNEDLIDARERRRLREELDRHGTVALARHLGYDFHRSAQPFLRAHEIALKGYREGEASLGAVAEIFGLSKEEMRQRLKSLDVHQEFRPDDALVPEGA